MKKFLTYLIVVLSTISLFGQETGTLKDPRDGKVYKTTKIGNQWIMAENLAYKPNNGDYWAYNNEEKNVAKYGYLYDFITARTIAPKGWHLPTKEEWETLYTFLGGDNKVVYNKMKPTGTSGFNALMGGYRYTDGTYNYLGDAAYFWSATAQGENRAWHIRYSTGYGTANLAYSARGCGFSVRLFQD